MRGHGRTAVPMLRDGGVSITRLACRLVLLFVLLCLNDKVLAQADPSEPAKSPERSSFQARVDAAALALRDSDPRFQSLSPVAARRLVEFTSGNMLFVALHELGHAVITQMGLPVLSYRLISSSR